MVGLFANAKGEKINGVAVATPFFVLDDGVI